MQYLKCDNFEIIEFGIDENVAWTAHVLAAKNFYSKNSHSSNQSHCIEVVWHFYGKENEIWAGFGPVGNTEKNGGWLWATFEGVFSCFQGQKNNLKCLQKIL